MFKNVIKKIAIILVVFAGQSFAATVAYYDFEVAGYAGNFYSVWDTTTNVLDILRGHSSRGLTKNADIASFVNEGSYSGFAINGTVYSKNDALFQSGADEGLTVEGFLKIGTNMPAETVQMIPYTVYDPAATGSWKVYLNRADTNADWKVLFNVNGNIVESQAVITNDTWFYIAAVRDAVNDEMRLYLDTGTGLSIVDSLSVDSGAIDSSTLRVGYEHWAGLNELYYGYMDNTRISNVALSGDDFFIPLPPPTGMLIVIK